VRKQFVGTIARVGATQLTMRVIDGGHVWLEAGAAVLEQARLMGVGRMVRFSAELDERTQCLSKPLFVVSSQHGLSAVSPTDAAS
jgi:hypothetical protein